MGRARLRHPWREFLAKNPVSIMTAIKVQAERLWPLVKEQRSRLTLGLVAVCLSVGLTLLYPQVIRITIDQGIGEGSTDLIHKLALLMVGILLIEAPAAYVRSYFFDTAARRAIVRIQEILHARLLSQEIGFFDKENAGQLNGRLASDAGAVSQLVSVWIPEGLRFSISGILGLALMAYTSPLLSSVVLIVAPTVGLATSIIGRKIQTSQAREQREAAVAYGVGVESLFGIRTVRLHNREAEETGRYTKALRKLLVAGDRRARAVALLAAITTFSSELAVVVGIWGGGMMITAEQLSTGELVSFVFYAGLVVRSFKRLSSFGAAVMGAHGATELIYELLDRENQLKQGSNLRPSHAEGLIELEAVHFSYPTRPDIRVLKGMDLRIEPGEFVAVVGPSGMGKSTIGNLMVRFYDPNEGRILFDGVDVSELDPKWLRTQVILVSQDSTLFSRSIGDNIRYGSEDATTEEVQEALTRAQVTEFIDRHPGGLETIVGDRGSNFSGGQRQRINLTRALLRKPRVLILDEATSALDAESEVLIKDSLRKLPYNPTIIIVAHRLSTVIDADRVVVIQDGRVVADGPHDTLVQSSQAYRDLIESQLVSG
jgi:ABC-type multidrug transport system fused ATPase/permease subunit